MFFMMKLSAQDVTILSELQSGTDDGRLKLAERLGVSSTTLWRRVNELKKSGVIRNEVTLLDPDKIGYPVCVFVFVNLKDYSVETRTAFEAVIEQAPEIMECYAVTGAHDYTLIVRSRSVRDFERFLMDEILNHPGVESASSQIALRQHKYTTAFPLDASGPETS